MFRPEASMVVLVQRREQAVALPFLLLLGERESFVIFWEKKWKHKETNYLLHEPLPEQTNLIEEGRSFI